jgi:hypothetical protein
MVTNGTKIQSNGKTTKGVDLDNAEVKLIRKNSVR